jgi:hypothetical protein
MGMPDATFSVTEPVEAGVKCISVGSALARLAFGTVVPSAREMRSAGTFHFSKSLDVAVVEPNRDELDRSSVHLHRDARALAGGKQQCVDQSVHAQPLAAGDPRRPVPVERVQEVAD